MKPMTGRQRMLTALDGGVPDRLPASVHGWMRYWLENYAGGISPEEAYEKFGLDWSLYRWNWIKDENSRGSWDVSVKNIEKENGNRIEVTIIVTPEKTFRQERMWDKYSSPWVTDYLFKEPDDVLIYCKYHPREYLDPDCERESLEIVGDKGIARGWRIGPWHELCELYGVEKMIYATFENPSWVHDAMSAMTGVSMRAFESMRDSKIDLLETGGGHNSSTVVSPSLFKEFILPYEKQIHDFLTGDLKIRTVYHVCGGMMPILDDLVKIGSTAIETLTPPAMGGDVDLADIMKKVGGKVSLIGGFDQFNGFQNGTPDDTRQLVRHCFETAGAGGGYIMNPSDHFFDGPVENVAAYGDEARKCKY